ncbi:zinc finger protein 681-like [Cheilinus undulatus]|uniref:zinc finger protein 681-like n=1 Tax=Cheilinus undulatus TaxID=241271 RepID=UPI001BD489AA|nr:zinc finger protein 681-like [Cheilinus undulatus]
MEEAGRFQSQLSSVMEKLVLSAVTEINQLVCEYCAVLRLELSREKQDNSTLREKLKQHPPVSGFMQDGNDKTGVQLKADHMNSKDPTEEQDERTFISADCTFKSVTVKGEEALEEQAKLRVSPPVVSASCSQVGECGPYPAAQSSHFSSEPPEASSDSHADYNPSMEMQCRLSLSPSAAQFAELGFQIKREAESPDQQTQDEDLNLGFELQQGILGQMYSEFGGFPVCSTMPDIQTPSFLNGLQPAENQHMPRTLNMPNLSSNGQHPADRDAPCQQHENKRMIQYRTPLRFKCDFCGKGFPFLSMMKGHRLTHTGERNQVCRHCGKTFIRRSHLTRHEILHMGVKPFTCQVCGRSFSRHAHLSSHMKTHSL